MDCLLLSLLLILFLKILLFKKKSFLFGNNFRFIEVTRNSQATFIQSHLLLTLHFFITFVFSYLSLSLSLYIYIIYTGFHDGSDGKASACNAGNPGSIPGSGRFPWRRKWQPTPVLLPRKFHG